MVIAHCIGVTRMILDFVYPSPRCGEVDTRPAIASKVHPMYFSSGHLVSSVVLMWIISLCTQKPSEDQVRPNCNFISGPYILCTSVHDSHHHKLERKSVNFVHNIIF